MKIKHFGINRTDEAENENMSLITEIKKINSEIEKAYESFQNQTDDDLLEASIYKIKELRSRQNYFLKKARENKAEAVYMRFEAKEKIKDA